MNEQLTAWFHCGRCASLFRAVAGGNETRRCTECGADPVIAIEGEPGAPDGPKDPMLRVKRADVEKPKFVTREVVRHKSRYFALKLIVVWALLMLALAVGARYFWKEEPRAAAAVDGNAHRGLADRDALLLEKVYPKCVRTLAGFISARTPEEKNQFVRTPIETAGRMARFYQANPIHNFDPSQIRGVGSGVITLKDGNRLVESRWSTADGQSFDAVFFENRGEWQLDWEDFVRYGDEPWGLFLSGSGDAEAEFRLFARERVPGERTVGSVRFFLHAPVFGQPEKSGAASAEFSIDQFSRDGQMLVEAFKKRAEGGRIYDSSLETRDPEGMIRLRVKVRRVEGAESREFKIVEIKACHWLSIDDPGIEK